jgi:hypothetical protein
MGFLILVAGLSGPMRGRLPRGTAVCTDGFKVYRLQFVFEGLHAGEGGSMKKQAILVEVFDLS